MKHSYYREPVRDRIYHNRNPTLGLPRLPKGTTAVSRDGKTWVKPDDDILSVKYGKLKDGRYYRMHRDPDWDKTDRYYSFVTESHIKAMNP